MSLLRLAGVEMRMAIDDGEAEDAALKTSAQMLREVIGAGKTLEEVAHRWQLTRPAVAKRIKSLVVRLNQHGAIEGLNRYGAGSVLRLREHRDAILAALEQFAPNEEDSARRASLILSDDDIAQAVVRIRRRSVAPVRDAALFYALLSTGARPLEIARLQVRDFWTVEGEVRRESEWRAEATIAGRARPLLFNSNTVNRSIGDYLASRVQLGHGLGREGQYGGLGGRSGLFLTHLGQDFKVEAYGGSGQRRFRCRPILETYRTIMRDAEIDHGNPLALRHTMVDRLYRSGAHDDQVAELLGVSKLSSLRELYPRPRYSLVDLAADLIP